MIKDSKGNIWSLEDAIIRILFERYPNEITFQELSTSLDTHSNFLKKSLDSLEKNHIISENKGFLLTRTGQTLGRLNFIMVKCGEAIFEGSTCHIIASEPQKLFTKHPSFEYFNFP
jgi:predicted ArsR family transcriptional regulator